MLNSKKIKVMTKLAMFEQKDGKEDIKISKYYKTDYVRFQVLKTIVSATIGYALILLLIGIYNAEYIISRAISLDFARIGQLILGFYIIILAAYGIGSFVFYSFHYDQSRKKLNKYFKLLKILSNMHREEKERS